MQTILGKCHFTEEDNAYVNYVKTSKILDGKTLKTTIKNYYKTSDKKSLDLIVGSFQKLIVKIAKDTQEKFVEAKGFDLMELVQEGNYSLIRALNLYKNDKTKGYNPNKKIMPSTYFTTVITRCLSNYVLRKGYTYKATDKEKLTMRRVKSVYGLSQSEHITLDTALKRYNNIEKKKKIAKIILNKNDLIKYNPLSVCSIYEEVVDNKGEKVLISDTIQDEKTITPEQYCREEEIYNILKKKLSTSDYKFMVNVMEGHNNKELSKIYNLPSKEIKQRKESICNKLKQDKQIKAVLGLCK